MERDSQATAQPFKLKAKQGKQAVATRLPKASSKPHAEVLPTD
jgi:hypothetical protein